MRPLFFSSFPSKTHTPLKPMCHPCSEFYAFANRDSLLLILLPLQPGPRHTPRRAAEKHEAQGGSGTRWCLCSPTRHAGSFRCRHHRGEYAFGRGRRSKDIRV
ncbi:hypothetical protein MLD38_014364 [Melastoma candidum]|uniref:Uncharacterized protein n=1 Tax=Melastoma candidum TaxID=119954 RepID=A0ACB9RDV0_9MYRT|nr:hypothetical protein MLD38_014364 [Melastoma candidum]